MPADIKPGETPAEQEPIRFSSALSIIILTRPAGTEIDWQEVDRGPGYFAIPADQDIRVRIKGINDSDLIDLVNDLQGVKTLRFLDLSENRNVTNEGLERVKLLKHLVGINLSSVSMSNRGLEALRELRHLSYLNLSYCNKLNDSALKILEAMRNLEIVDLKGCLGMTNGGLARVRRKNLTILR